MEASPSQQVNTGAKPAEPGLSASTIKPIQTPAYPLAPNSRLVDRPGYLEFMSGLSSAFSLLEGTRGLGDLTLVQGAAAESGGLPSATLYTHKDGSRPGISIDLRPTNGADSDAKFITQLRAGDLRSFLPHNAPLIVRDIEQLASSSLAQFFVRSEYGSDNPGNEIPYSQEISLKAKLQSLPEMAKYSFARFPDSTEVVRAVAIVPKSQAGIFTTEFVPQIHIPGQLSATSPNFAIWSLVGDSFSHRCWLQMNAPYDVKRHMGNSKSAQFEPVSFEDMSDFQKFIAPGVQSGHVVLALCPFRELPKQPDYSKFLSYSPSEGLTRSASFRSFGIGRTDIVAGSAAGKSQIHTDPLFPVEGAPSIIFDIQILALDPKQIQDIEPARFAELVRGQFTE